MSAGEGSADTRRLPSHSRSNNRASLSESLTEQQRVEKVLRDAGLVQKRITDGPSDQSSQDEAQGSQS
jgi:hypothetical protein